MNFDMSQGCMLINGEWAEADSGKTFDVVNPATGERLGTMPNGGPAETARAIAAAHDAFGTWSKTTASQRSALLYRWYELIQRHGESLASVITLESGKPIGEARAELQYGNGFILWYAEEAKRNYGRTIPAFVPGKQILAIQQPVGVAAAITPWNFPCAMVTRKLAPALAAGCTVVLKPAEETPFTSYFLLKLAEEAGIPKGVLNMVTGEPAPIGNAIMEDKRVRKISFTGSNEVGKLLIRGSAEHMKRVSLELGGNAPFIVFDDADLDKAVAGAIASKFRNAGQTCICANRFYVQSGIADRFAERMAEAVSRFNIGNGLDEATDIGPLIDGAILAKVKRHVDDAVSKGAEVMVGGKPLEGLYFAPTVLKGVTKEMIVCHEETFGPVVPMIRFDTEEEAIRMANDSDFGLAAYAYTRDLSRAARVYEALEFGMVGLNDAAISTVQVPFGGMKESGLGREGGTWGMEAYLETKYVSIGL